MNWYYILCLSIVFYCGYKIGKNVIMFNIANRMSKLDKEDQASLTKILIKMGELK